MKTKVTLKGLEIGNIKVGDIVVESEFFVKEAWGMKNLIKNTTEDLLHNMPKYLEQVATAYEKYEELSQNLEEKRAESHLPMTLEVIRSSYNIEMAEDAVKRAYEQYPSKFHDEIHKAFVDAYNNLTCGLGKFKELNRKVIFADTYKELQSIHEEAIRCLKSEYLPDLENSIKERKKIISDFSVNNK